MSIFIPKADHLEILNEIGRWKVVPLRMLFEEIGNGIQYPGFSKKIKRLEQLGVIKSFEGNRCTKYLALTCEGGKISY